MTKIASARIQPRPLHRLLERLRRALEAAVMTVAGSVWRASSSTRADRVAERDARLQVERQRHRRQLAGVVDRQRADRLAASSTTADSGTSLPLGRLHVEHRQRRGILLDTRGATCMITWYSSFGA